MIGVSKSTVGGRWGLARGWESKGKGVGSTEMRSHAQRFETVSARVSEVHDQLKRARNRIAGVYQANDVVAPIGRGVRCPRMDRQMGKRLRQSAAEATALSRAAAGAS